MVSVGAAEGEPPASALIFHRSFCRVTLNPLAEQRKDGISVYLDDGCEDGKIVVAEVVGAANSRPLS